MRWLVLALAFSMFGFGFFVGEASEDDGWYDQFALARQEVFALRDAVVDLERRAIKFALCDDELEQQEADELEQQEDVELF